MTKSRSSKMKLDSEATIRERVFMVIALVLILYIFFENLWAPQSKRVRDIKIRMKGVQSQIDDARLFIDATDKKLAQQLKERAEADDGTALNRRIQKIIERQMLGIDDEKNSAIDFLRDKNSARGISVERADFDKQVDKKEFSIVPIALRVKGRYSSVLKYFDTIENAPRPLVVRTFGMTNSPEGVTVDMIVELLLMKRN